MLEMLIVVNVKDNVNIRYILNICKIYIYIYYRYIKYFNELKLVVVIFCQNINIEKIYYYVIEYNYYCLISIYK